MSKSIGIIGGMGPLATADLYLKIVQNTDAVRDSEHPHVIIDSNTSVPDRTAAILSGGISPLPELTASAKRLRDAGADFLIMSCNTAHYFLKDLRQCMDIPIVSTLELTARILAERGIKKAGLLATDGVIRSGIFADALLDCGITPVIPDEAGQREVMHMIYDCVKAGITSPDTTFLREALEKMAAEGAECFVLGCTELPILFENPEMSCYAAIDPTLELAREAVRLSGCKVKN